MAACKKDCPTPPPPVTQLFEPVKDTCFNVSCSSPVDCPYRPAHRRVMVFGTYNPTDSNIVFLLCVDSSNVLKFNYAHGQFLKINLTTGDTSSFAINTFRLPEIDKNGWMYYVNEAGLFVKSKTDGSQFKKTLLAAGNSYKMHVNPNV